MRIALDLPPGLVSDDTSFASTGRYEDGSNVRFWRGKPQVIGGWAAAASEKVTGKCRTILAWADNDAILNIGFGTHSKLQVLVGGGLYDITPAGLAAGNEDGVGGPGYGADTFGSGAYGVTRPNFYPRTWSLSTYGETLIANPRLGRIYQWSNDSAAAAVELSNAPTTVVYAMVTPERQLLALGCNEEASGRFNPLCIRFSDIENLTSWTTSSSNNAGEVILEGGGRIVAGRLLGNGVAVWTDNAVYFGTFTGDTTQPWRFDRVEENCGLIGPNAVAIVNQAAYWIGPDLQPRMWALGVSTPQIIPCPIRNDFADHLAEGQADKIVATSISRFGEVWWHYPDVREGNENSRFIAVSTMDGAWFRGELPRSAACDAGLAGYPVMVSPDGEVFYHEIGFSANGGNLQWRLKTAAQYLEEGGRHLLIRDISPDFEDQLGAISLTVATREYPQGAETQFGPSSLAQHLSRVDLFASGSVVSLAFAGASNPSYMRFGKPIFDVVPRGKR